MNARSTAADKSARSTAADKSARSTAAGMFRHLLVPLDGSRLAESAIRAAATIAIRMKAAVTLVHVIEKNSPTEVHRRERHLSTPEEAAAYLSEVARDPLFSGLKMRTHVHTAETRDVAKSITEHSVELTPDLIVMSTHGKGGARRLLFGDIAQQIIALGRTPVLLVRPPANNATADMPAARGARADGVATNRATARKAPAGRAAVAAWRTVLTPLNGDPSHEKGLEVAVSLSLAFGARLHLLMVVPTLGKLSGSRAAAGMLLPRATREILELDDAGARDYLEALAAEPRRMDVETMCETSRDDPARAIVAAVHRLGAEVVVMGTHGRAGTDAFWAGSVAARVISRTRVPLLLVPLRDFSRQANPRSTAGARNPRSTAGAG